MSRGWILNFDGVNDFAEATDNSALNLGDTFEIEFEMRPLNLTGTRTLISKGTGAYQLRLFGAVLQLLKQGTGVIAETDPGRLTLGAWHHVNVFKDGADVGLLVDLQDRTVTISPQTLVDTSTSLYVGALGGTSEHFAGSLKDIRFWAEPRTQAQRRKYKTRPLIPEDPALKTWWPVYERTGSILHNVAL
jgi:hypothetical protein